MEIIVTEFEKKKAQLHKDVCDMYAKLKEQYPDTAPTRLFESIARVVGLTAPGVRGILVAHDKYQGRARV